MFPCFSLFYRASRSYQSAFNNKKNIVDAPVFLCSFFGKFLSTESVDNSVDNLQTHAENAYELVT